MSRRLGSPRAWRITLGLLALPSRSPCCRTRSATAWSRRLSASRARWWAGRWPGGSPETRSAGCITCLFVATAFSTPGQAVTLAGWIGSAAWFGVAALPVCIGVAILKYRLYEIDRIVSRTLAYAIVTGLLVGVYAGLVLLATEVLRFHSTVAVAASTLAAAALFSPVRRWVQRAVDRRFNRARYNAERMVTEFAGRLQDAVDPDAVRADLAGVVVTALEPASISVWVNGSMGS